MKHTILKIIIVWIGLLALAAAPALSRAHAPPNAPPGQGGKTAAECAAPEDLKIMMTSPAEAEVVWKPAPGVKSYKFRYKAESGSQIYTMQISQPPLVLTDLVVGETYLIEGASVCANKTSKPVRKKFRAYDPGAQCKPILDIESVSVNGTYAAIKWDNPEGAYVAYEVTVTGGDEPIISRETRNQMVIRGLNPSTEYQVSIKGICQNQSVVPATDQLTFTTGEKNICPAPNEFYAAYVTHDRARLEWTDMPEGKAYKVQWRLKGEEEWESTVTNNNTVTLANLLTRRKYEARIVMRCGEKSYSEPDEPIIFRTVYDCEAPRLLTVSDVASREAKFEWDEVKLAKGYEIRYRSQDADGWTTLAAAFNTFYVKNLAPGERYEAQVRAICRDSVVSTYSGAQFFSTKEDFSCRAVGGISVSPGPLNANVSWRPFANSDGYVISWKRADEAQQWHTITLHNETQSSYAIHNLERSTNYLVRIKPRCNKQAAWQAATFSTLRPESSSEEIIAHIRDNFSIYPNPVKGPNVSIAYELPENKKGKLEVFNLMGGQLENVALTQPKGSVELKTSDLSNGIFFCKISVDEDHYVIKRLVVTQ